MRLKQQKIMGVSKVIGLSKLRTKYEAPEAKRNLCSAYDVFLADDRILPSLPKAIGATHPNLQHKSVKTLLVCVALCVLSSSATLSGKARKTLAEI